MFPQSNEDFQRLYYQPVISVCDHVWLDVTSLDCTARGVKKYLCQRCNKTKEVQDTQFRLEVKRA